MAQRHDNKCPAHRPGAPHHRSSIEMRQPISKWAAGRFRKPRAHVPGGILVGLPQKQTAIVILSFVEIVPKRATIARHCRKLGHACPGLRLLQQTASQKADAEEMHAPKIFAGLQRSVRYEKRSSSKPSKQHAFCKRHMQEVNKQAVERNPGENRENKRNEPSLFRQFEVEKRHDRYSYGKSKEPDGDKVAQYPSGDFDGLAPQARGIPVACFDQAMADRFDSACNIQIQLKERQRQTQEPDDPGEKTGTELPVPSLP
jgi:hypothetical protein